MTPVPTALEALAAFYVNVGSRVLAKRAAEKERLEQHLRELGKVEIPEGAEERCWDKIQREIRAEERVSACPQPAVGSNTGRDVPPPGASHLFSSREAAPTARPGDGLTREGEAA